MEIVAELSANHLGSLILAKKLIARAKQAGADAVKIQCWTPELMCGDRTYVLPSGQWEGRNLSDLYREAWTPDSWWEELFEYAADVGIECFASVFDLPALQRLEEIGCPRYKIASFEALDVRLVDAVVSTGKPIIVSTGLMSHETLLKMAWHWNCGNTTLLACVSEYPAEPSQYNLSVLGELKSCADFVGVSDHTLGQEVPIVAASLGADMLEKHFTLRRSNGGLDSAFSVTPNELSCIVSQCRIVDQCIGTPKMREPSEEALSLGRSLYVVNAMVKGEPLTPEIIRHNIVSMRPALGIPAIDVNKLVGKVMACDLPAGSPLTWGCLVDLYELASSH